MRPPSLEELLFQKLMSSHVFHSWVRRVHARINRIPLEEQSPENATHIRLDDYSPTTWHRVNAFRVLLWDELKKAFTFRS